MLLRALDPTCVRSAGGSTAASQRLARRLYYSAPFRRSADLASRAFHRLLASRAREVSAELAGRSCLVLAPHPDDETLACGATIRRKTAAGAAVVVAIVTDGRYSHRSSIISADELVQLRRAEALTACSALGVPADAVRFLDFEEGSLGRERDALVTMLRQLITERRPQDVFIPSARDLHPDHRELNAAALAALAAADPRPSAYEYPVWFWDAQAWIDRGTNPIRMVVSALARLAVATVRLRPVSVGTDGQLPGKLAALEAYRSQFTNLTGEPSWATFDPRFLAHFTGRHELFFPVDLGAGAR